MWPTRIEVERIEVEAIHVHYIVAYEGIHGGRNEEAAQSSGLSETPELLCRTLHVPQDRHRSSPAPYWRGARCHRDTSEFDRLVGAQIGARDVPDDRE